MMLDENRSQDNVRRRANRIWSIMVAAWFLSAILLTALFHDIGGLIALVLLVHVLIARALLFRAPNLTQG